MLIKKNAGFTLMELMVALAINMLLITALVAIFSNNLYHYNKTLSTNQLNQQLQAAMTLMATDIRRAGYWANANSNVGTSPNNNPFMSTSSGTDVSTAVSDSCILFAYDRNNNGTLPSISSASDDERYGYRLKNGVLQTRPYGATFDCTAAASNWENVTDSAITITALTFTLTTKTITAGSNSSGTLIMRSVDISITGQLASDTSITKTLTQHVRIRNDKFTP